MYSIWLTKLETFVACRQICYKLFLTCPRTRSRVIFQPSSDAIKCLVCYNVNYHDILYISYVWCSHDRRIALLYSLVVYV